MASSFLGFHTSVVQFKSLTLPGITRLVIMTANMVAWKTRANFHLFRKIIFTRTSRLKSGLNESEFGHGNFPHEILEILEAYQGEVV